MNVTLVIVPGPGAKRYPLSSGATLQDLADASPHDLSGRNFVLNGRSVKSVDWSNTYVKDGDEVFATKAVKGA